MVDSVEGVNLLTRQLVPNPKITVQELWFGQGTQENRFFPS